MMISNEILEQYKAQNLSDANIEDLVDITTIQIDTSRPVLERILIFMMQIRNPYLFKVGDTAVKVSFTEGAPTLEQSLEKILTKNAR